MDNCVPVMFISHKETAMKFSIPKGSLAICILTWFAAATASAAWAGGTSGSLDASPPYSAQALPSALRLALYRTLAKDAGAPYRIGENGCLELAESGLGACFDREGSHFSGAASQLTLHLMAYGRGRLLSPVKTVSPVIEANHVDYVHGNLTEWWRALPIGFEQGFTLTKRPSGHGKLVLALATSNHIDEHSGAFTWKNLHYGNLVVTDAKDHVIPATLKSDGKRLLISVNDRHAIYPLTVDPLVWLEQKVVATNGQTRDDYGKSVAIFGKTALVGAYHEDIDNNVDQGAVYVFSKSEGTWKEVQKLVASDGAANGWFGDTVALDGTVAVVGANGASINGNAFQGAVYVFKKSNGKWIQTQKIIANDGTAYANFGDALALSRKTIVVGAHGNGSYPGAVYVFSNTENGWVQSQKLVAFGKTGPNDNFGASVAINGETILVGAPLASNGNGSAYLFQRINSIWRPYQILTATGGKYFNQFGQSVALSDSTALIGTMMNKVYVFGKSGNSWSQTQELTPDFPTAGLFGYAVALQNKTAVIGAEDTGVNGHSDEGAVFIFSKSGASWEQTGVLTSSDRTGGGILIGGGQLGSSVAISGTTVLAGAYHATVNGVPLQGAAYFFGRSDLGLALSSPGRVNPDSEFSSSIIATNSSSATSPAVSVSIAVPAAASFISATPTRGTCGQNPERVRCNLGAIPGNAGAARVDITLKVLGEAGGIVNDRAEVIYATPSLSAVASSVINHLPVADGGRLNAEQGKPASGTLKASDADDDPLVFSIVTPPKHGSVIINDPHKGVYTYTPDAGYSGADSFTFKVNDGYADSNVASVIVYLANQPPVASDGALTTRENTDAKGMLQAIDPDGGPLGYSIVAPPGHGSLRLDASTGSYTYTPVTDYFGADSFTFKANDGQADSNVATVSITIKGSAPPPPPPSNDSGGGSFGGLMLLLLAALTATVFLLRRGWNSRMYTTLDAGTANPAAQKEKLMHHNWMRVVAGGAMVFAIVLSAVPLTAQAHSTAPASDSIAKSGYRAGLTMPLPVTRAAPRRVALAPQSSLSLLARATELGPHASDATIKITVGLKLRNVAKLKAFLQKVQNPHSAVYHQWLTPQQFAKRYSPTQTAVAQLVTFLKAHGIKITSVSPNRTLIHTAATTRAYEGAFGIQIKNYRLNGRNFYSSADSPMLPRAIEPLVSNILGLNHGVQMRPYSQRQTLQFDHGVAPRQAPPPSTTYFNPQQIAKAYDWPDITDTNNGTGVSISILTALTQGVATNSNYHDFWEAFGLPDHVIDVIPVGGASTNNSGAVETALDIEWSGVMAPGATLRVYVAANSTSDTFTDMYNQFVTDNTSQVMSTSWGLAESGHPDNDLANEQIFMQAAAQGISMFAAAGDNGAADCAPFPGYCPPGPNNADFPSSSTYITAANGTELTISDISGTYGDEHAWADTGGAISQLFAKPVWQTGPGLPTNVNNRMNSDVAMNAGSLHPYLLYVNGQQGTGFYGVGGTSAVAPILAGLFAIGVSQQPGGVSLGQSNSLIYNDVNANSNNYRTDFHDVTSGCNGYLPDGTTLSCATTNWDHPTGWGSPKGKSLLSHLGVQGAAGVVRGEVTDAASGATVTRAIVTVSGNGTDQTQVSTNGSFVFALPPGNYTITATSFGYDDGSASVTVSDGETTTQNIALEAAPTVTLSGKVSDGSGHDYGLYAEIKASVDGVGQVADFWTDPATGNYSVELPKGFDYTLNVTAAFNGYQPGTAEVNLPGNETQNFSLDVAAACTAPGYAMPFSEDFNTAWPPTGWTVVNAANVSPLSWQSNVKWNTANWTGGTGLDAQVGTSTVTMPGGPYDTSLVTPPIMVSSVQADPILTYKANYQPPGIAQALDLDISTDGGNNWTNLVHWTNQFCGTNQALPGCKVTVDIGSHLPAKGNFQLRWRFYNNLQSTWIARYGQIDDVKIGGCQAVPGGLAFGRVTDANTGAGITFASVEDDQGNKVDTTANPADSSFPVGGYLMFLPAGARTLTVNNHYYQSANASFTMSNGAIHVQDFALKAGQLAGDPGVLNLHVMVNNFVNKPFTVENTGSAPAHFTLVSVDSPAPVNATARGHGASLIRIKGKFSPLQSAQARKRSSAVQTNVPPKPHVAPWQDIAGYPVAVWDNGVALDPASGTVYSVDGVSSAGDYLSAVYAYDPVTNVWNLVAHDAVAREAPQVAFIHGKLYVTGGLLSNGALEQRLDIYDPATGAWADGAKIPAAYYGSGRAVVNGNLYVVGGCVIGTCASTDVQVYDPAADRWKEAAEYPHPVAFVSCGGIDDKLYCAGGTSASGASSNYYKDAYVYDPATNQWSPIPDMPAHLWGSSYAAADDVLVVSGGALGAGAVTNAGYAYDPAADHWYDLPNSNQALLRGGSACGFYRIGGTQGGGAQQAVASAERLPGYDQCGNPAPIPWLTPAPKSATVAAGATSQATFIFDGTGQKEFTTSHAYVRLQSNTPYPDQVVPLTVTWDPQPVNIVLSGKVAPEQVRKGNALIYTLTVYNRQTDNHGAATTVALKYALPAGISYETASGDANSCTENDGTVTCDFGTIALGASKTETLAVKAADAGKLTSQFMVSAREPDSNRDDNQLTLTSEVIGSADLSLGAADSAMITAGSTGSLKLTLKNTGPDPAAEVQLHAKSLSGAATLRSATASQGHCALSGGELACTLGQVDAGATATVTVQLFGAYAGSATVNAQASTASDEPDTDNNGIAAKVTVKAPPPPDNGAGSGGGAFGGLALVALLALGFATRLRRRPA